MLNIVIFGAPGSGKGTQSERIVAKYGINHISTGDVLRAEIKNNTELGKIAKGYIDQGQLIPDELIIDILAKTLDSFEDSKGVIFDGFPRTIPQAEALSKIIDIDSVVNFDIADNEVVGRLSGRRVCKNCGQNYHVEFMPPKSEGKCDKCDSELYTRDDDKIEAITHRLEVYRSQTAPLIDFYREKNLLTDN